MLDFLKIDWLSLTIPLAYLAVLVGSLATFSSLYRKRKSRTLNPQNLPAVFHLPCERYTNS